MEPFAKDVLKSYCSTTLFFNCSDTHKTSIFRDIFLWFFIRNDSDLCEKMLRYKATVQVFLPWNPNNTYHVVHHLAIHFS